MEKLPERWCIRVTPENSQIITNWLNENLKKTNQTHDYKNVIGHYIHYPSTNEQAILKFKYGNHCYAYVKNSYKEITFEQFKTYVLNQSENTINTNYSIF